MKPGFLTQICVMPVTGITLTDANHYAKKLGFKMFSHNGMVYSVAAFDLAMSITKTNAGIKIRDASEAQLFMLSDLVDYNYNIGL